MTRWGFLKGESVAPSLTPPGVSEAAGKPYLVSAHSNGTGAVDGDGVVRVTDLKAYGVRTAGASHASPEVLKTVIGWLYHNKLHVEDLHASGEYERVRQVGDQVAVLERDLTNAKHKATTCAERLAAERDKIASRRAELGAVRAGDGTVVQTHGLSDRLSFFIAAGILGVLTVYLFLFYVSAIYNAFLFDPMKAAEEGLQTGRQLSVTIFNGEAFQKAWASGLMTFAFVASAPSIVLGLGFLIHHFQRAKRFFVVGLILAVTLLFDILIAHEIVYQIHRIKVLTGEVTSEFTLRTMAMSGEFWIIVMAGFVVYVIWGFILEAVLEGIEKFHPARVAERRLRESIAQLEKACDEFEEQQRAAAKDVVRLEAELKALDHQRSPRELQNRAFGRHVDELMQGWLTYIAQAFPGEVAEKQNEAQMIRQSTVALLTGGRA